MRDFDVDATDPRSPSQLTAATPIALGDVVRDLFARHAGGSGAGVPGNARRAGAPGERAPGGGTRPRGGTRHRGREPGVHAPDVARCRYGDRGDRAPGIGRRRTEEPGELSPVCPNLKAGDDPPSASHPQCPAPRTVAPLIIESTARQSSPCNAFSGTQPRPKTERPSSTRRQRRRTQFPRGV